jgi:hypothetical protein
MATTVAAVRDTMISTVKALTPTSLANRKFRHHREDVDYSDFCERNPAAAFRLFTIRDTFAHVSPVVSNMALEELQTTIECVVCYPKQSEYLNDSGQRRPLLDRDDILREDIKQVRDAIGVNGYMTIDSAGGNATVFSENVGVDVAAACVYIVLRLGTMYREAMP